MPSWRDAYRAEDQTGSYRHLRRVLQAIALQSGSGGTRWVLKSPQHLEQVGPLLAAYRAATGSGVLAHTSFNAAGAPVVAVGRGPNATGMGFEEVGVAMDRGFVLRPM